MSVPPQAMSLGGQRSEDMQHLTSGPTGGQQAGLNSGYGGLMDDTDDYMDYMGGASPLGLSSESSNQDRSCSSTPVGNEGSPAGELATGGAADWPRDCLCVAGVDVRRRALRHQCARTNYFCGLSDLRLVTVNFEEHSVCIIC